MYWGIYLDFNIFIWVRANQMNTYMVSEICLEKETNQCCYWHDILKFQVYFFSFLVSTKYYPPLNLGNNKIKQDLLEIALCQ